jgi:hypothetical protein
MVSSALYGMWYVVCGVLQAYCAVRVQTNPPPMPTSLDDLLTREEVAESIQQVKVCMSLSLMHRVLQPFNWQGLSGEVGVHVA